MSRRHQLQQRIGAIRSKIEGRLIPDPASILGSSFYPPVRDTPHWFLSEDVVPVAWMTGFRMSFRSNIIRSVKFDEKLTRYSLFEDIDASFGAWKLGWVVGARRAKIYHFRSPEKRDGGFRLGAQQLLNKAYVIYKHSSPGDLARFKLNRFASYKVLQYKLGAFDHHGMQRYMGAVAAKAIMGKLVASGEAEEPLNFIKAMDTLI